jgi:hypothetical protein
VIFAPAATKIAGSGLDSSRIRSDTGKNPYLIRSGTGTNPARAQSESDPSLAGSACIGSDSAPGPAPYSSGMYFCSTMIQMNIVNIEQADAYATSCAASSSFPPICWDIVYVFTAVGAHIVAKTTMIS